MQTLMKVLKNLFGNNTKISASDIAVKGLNSKGKLLNDCIIVDSGTNINGTYIKWGNGMMLVTKQLKITTKCSSSWGSIYESPNIDFGKMASSFCEIPFVFSYATQRMAFVEGLQGTTENNFGKTWLARPSADENEAVYYINLFAIGKWK